MGPSSLLQFTSRIKEILYTQPTLTAKDVLLLYREPGVETGYRPAGKSWFYYALSIFQVNNETVNIWTHFLPTLVFIHTFFILPDTADGRANAWPFVAFGISSIVCVLLSTFAHTIHSRSPHLHYICYQMDYAGIGLNNIGSNTIMLFTGCPIWLYQYMQPFHFLNVLIGWVCMIGNSMAKLKYRRPYPPQRKMMQLSTGALSVAPSLIILLSRLGTCLVDTDCSLATLSHHGRWVSSVALCIFFFSSHLPEKLYPGKFDFIGQGHQIFHVFQATSRILQYNAGHIDIMGENWSQSMLDDGSLLNELMTYCLYITGCVFIIVVLNSKVDRRVEEDLKLS